MINEWDNIKHFKKDEFACPCCNKNKINFKLVVMLDLARKEADIPFVINSAYRCDKHNKEVKGSKTSSHLKGLAVDIKCIDSRQRFKIVSALLKVGFTRILIYRTIIHCDIDDSKAQRIITLMC